VADDVRRHAFLAACMRPPMRAIDIRPNRLQIMLYRPMQAWFAFGWRCFGQCGEADAMMVKP